MNLSAKEAKERIKNQQENTRKKNAKINEKYDRISVLLPKGYKKEIENLGLTVNGAVNDAMRQYIAAKKRQRQEAIERDRAMYDDLPFK